MKKTLAQIVHGSAFITLMLSTCVCIAEDRAPNPPVAQPEGATQPNPTDAKDSNWVITVNDSVTLNFGPVKVVKKATMRAVNTSGKIEGEYTGSFAFNDTQTVRDPHGRVDGKSTTNAKNLKFTLFPYLQPLTQPKGDLNPLVKPGDSPDYQGEGTMDWITQGSGTAEAEGKSTIGSNNRKDKMSFRIVVTGSLAKLILPSPKGEIFLNGSIQQGGEFVPHPLKVPAKDNGDFVPEPLVPPKK